MSDNPSEATPSSKIFFCVSYSSSIKTLLSTLTFGTTPSESPPCLESILHFLPVAPRNVSSPFCPGLMFPQTILKKNKTWFTSPLGSFTKFVLSLYYVKYKIFPVRPTTHLFSELPTVSLFLREILGVLSSFHYTGALPPSPLFTFLTYRQNLYCTEFNDFLTYDPSPSLPNFSRRSKVPIVDFSTSTVTYSTPRAPSSFNPPIPSGSRQWWCTSPGRPSTPCPIRVVFPNPMGCIFDYKMEGTKD